FFALQALEDRQLRNATLFCRSVAKNEDDVLALPDAAALDAADAEAADVVVVVDGRDEQLQRPVGVSRRRRNLLEDGVEERLHVVVRVLERGAHESGAATGVQDREIELLVGSAE